MNSVYENQLFLVKENEPNEPDFFKANIKKDNVFRDFLNNFFQ